MVTPSDPLDFLERKAKTARGRRFLKERAPKIIENPKRVLFIRGNKTTNDVNSFLRDLFDIRKPLATLFSQKHAEWPFEDVASLEKRCKQLDHSLFCLGASSKKRPFRIVLGRMFDNSLLDMQELAIKNFLPISHFKAKATVLGSKPLVLFQGAAFESNESLKRTKSLLLDLFAGPKPEQVLLSGLEQAIVCSTVDTPSASSADDTPVFVRRYRITYEKTGGKLPHVKMDEVGPRFEFVIGRNREPDRDRWKAAMRTPKAAKPRKVKNIETDALGRKRGRIHLGKQEFEKIHTVHHNLEMDTKRAKKTTSDAGGKAD